MASIACKKGVRSKKFLPASLVTDEGAPCAFCQRAVDDEVAYGKLYAIGDIQCHYFCVLLSCCLVQKGKDTEGLFGFLYPDIVAEVERSKKHRCSYCGRGGASLGCCVSQCRKQFHLPCGRERNSVSLFYGNYKSYCEVHAPKQKIPDSIMQVARLRMKKARSSLKAPASLSNLKELCSKQHEEESPSSDTESVCVICYEAVCGFPTNNTFWALCCARDAWFHRTCLQRMALTAGMHYLKCPLCNDKNQFYNAVLEQGYYVPDRDAAWELEQNAFAEIYERPLQCGEAECKCPLGRAHDADSGEWDIKACILCGTAGSHAACRARESNHFVCAVCSPAAPTDLDSLATSIDTLIRQEQAQMKNTTARRVMPSRMSLRRTKSRIAYNMPSTSRNDSVAREDEQPLDTKASRLELNLKSPRRSNQAAILKNIANTLPESDAERDRAREKIRSLPLSVNTRTVNNIIEDIFIDIMKEVRGQEWRSPKKTSEDIEVKIENHKGNSQNTDPAIRSSTPKKLPNTENEHENLPKLPLVENSRDKNMDDDLDDHSSTNSSFQLPSEFIAETRSDDSISLTETPKKLRTVEIEKNSSLEISENDQVVNVDMIKMENSPKNDFKIKIPLYVKKSRKNSCKALEEGESENIDMESFKNYYLTEVDKDFKCSFNHNHKNEEKSTKLRTAIDFAIEATKNDVEKKRKRKMATKDGVAKKRKLKKKTVVLKYKKNKNIEVVCSNDSKYSETIDVSVKPRSKRGKKLINIDKVRQNIRVKIRFKEERLRLKITESESKKTKIQKSSPPAPPPPCLKQYILKYSDNSSPNEILVKPEQDIKRLKRKYVKMEKSPDNLKQTSIQNFFRKVPNNE